LHREKVEENMQRLIVIAMLLSGQLLLTQNFPADEQRLIEFPDVPGYLTLVTDFHQHTVFSDGNVWPSIRVEEAIRDGLDVMAVTDHIEYQPHADDIPHPDRNRSYAIAAQRAEKSELLVVNGCEITRSMPPGHINAVFVEDVNQLNVDTAEAAITAADDQGAFIFWNHPMWTSQRPDGIATLLPMHKQLIAAGKLHGIEVVNMYTYSDEALAIALENNLTIMGTSDIHGLVDWDFNVAGGGHRPVTLVFAAEKSVGMVRQALFAGRTVVWFRNTLIGRKENLEPLVMACLQVEKTEYYGNSAVLMIDFRNPSDAEFILRDLDKNKQHLTADVIQIKPHATTRIAVKAGTRVDRLNLRFAVLNAIIAPGQHLNIAIEVLAKP
jgi:hypothetical protein